MLLTTVLEPKAVVANALAKANSRYNNNLKIIEGWQRGSRIRFVLRTIDSRAFGSRTSWTGRHMPAASWEAHRDFMQAIFDQDPNARLQTRMAVYRGLAGFLVTYPHTADRNVGSQMCPVTMPDLSVLL